MINYILLCLKEKRNVIPGQEIKENGRKTYMKKVSRETEKSHWAILSLIRCLSCPCGRAGSWGPGGLLATVSAGIQAQSLRQRGPQIQWLQQNGLYLMHVIVQR